MHPGNQETIMMVLKMTVLTALYVLLAFLLFRRYRDRKITALDRIGLGVIFGIMSILSTHFGVSYHTWVMNVRDLGPLTAGLFFDPVSGIIAGLIGGIERYAAAELWDVGAYTKTACSVSTVLAGFLAAFFNRIVFKGKRPSVAYALSVGAVMEVFHMYMIFITHPEDIEMAFRVVKAVSLPMIVFSAIGLEAIAAVDVRMNGEWINPFKTRKPEEKNISAMFQKWMIIVTLSIFAMNYTFNYLTETRLAYDDSIVELYTAEQDIEYIYYRISESGFGENNIKLHGIRRQVGTTGMFAIWEDDNDELIMSIQTGDGFKKEVRELILNYEPGIIFTANINNEKYLMRIGALEDNDRLMVMLPEEEVYLNRDIQGYESLFSGILLFFAIYVIMSLLVQVLVVDKLRLVNNSLDRITHGDLDEKVNVYSSIEFASLSDDINQTVDALKGYIDAAEKKMEQELQMAHVIQNSALPKKFDFDNNSFELYANMDPAREVGGDFYDYFFVGKDKLALVIADVAGKGIPAALFMMRSKTALRGIAEEGKSISDVLSSVNNDLCEGNEANMFVTVWIAVVDLNTGDVRAASAGHEYPALMRSGEGFELYKDKHGMPLGTMEGLKYREYDIHLEPGDCLYVYTDGVPEAINVKEEQYGTDRMLKALNRHGGESMEGVLRGVKRSMDRFVGKAEQFDDITMLGFRYNGKQLAEDPALEAMRRG